MMPAFEYASPTSLKEAHALLGPDAAPLAGGTDLLALIKDHVVAPRRLVDVKRLPELQGIRGSGGEGWRIGAAVTLEELAAHSVAREIAAIGHAVAGILSPQIVAMGTVGGDLCQRPRCWYFRSGFGLLGRKDGASLVRAGDNRYHAILGNAGDALFVNPSSLAPALAALGATVTLAGPGGERTVPVAEFFRAPVKDGESENVLRSGEIVVAVAIPQGVASWRTATYEVRAHGSLDWPLAAAAVALDLQAGSARTARVVLGHVAPVPWRATEAERALAGKAVTAETAEAAGRAAVAAAKPLSGNAYKVRLASVAVKRAILRAAGKEA